MGYNTYAKCKFIELKKTKRKGSRNLNDVDMIVDTPASGQDDFLIADIA